MCILSYINVCVALCRIMYATSFSCAQINFTVDGQDACDCLDERVCGDSFDEGRLYMRYACRRPHVAAAKWAGRRYNSVSLL